MSKPTSDLIHQVINYAIGDNRVYQLLNDKNKVIGSSASEIRCRFLGTNTADETKTGYQVDFLFKTRVSDYESSDLVRVVLEVTDRAKPPFRILKID